MTIYTSASRLTQLKEQQAIRVLEDQSTQLRPSQLTSKEDYRSDDSYAKAQSSIHDEVCSLSIRKTCLQSCDIHSCQTSTNQPTDADGDVMLTLRAIASSLATGATEGIVGAEEAGEDMMEWIVER